jgi:MFS family permease
MAFSRADGDAPGWRRGQVLVLALLLLTGVTNYVDRVALSVANPLIRAELHLSLSQMGLLLSAFVWAYALAQWPAGALIDRLGPRRLLASALVLWSAAQAVAGLAVNLAQFALARAALGVGEAPQFPVGARVVRTWFAPSHRGSATGIFNAASTLGPAIAPPLVTALMLACGWRLSFLIMGASGVVVAATWWALYRDPAAPVDAPPAASSLTAGGWARLVTSPTLWAMTAGNFGAGFMNWFYTAWLPGYFEIQRHVSIAKTGLLAAIPFAFGVAGSLLGGWLCDRLARAGLSPIASRKAPIVGGLIAGALFTGLAIGARNNTEAMAAICAAVFCSNLAGAAVWALAVAAAPPQAVASVGSVQNFGGLFGGALAPILTGLSVEATGSFATAQAATAAIASAGALVYLLGVRRPIADP